MDFSEIFRNKLKLQKEEICKNISSELLFENKHNEEVLLPPKKDDLIALTVNSISKEVSTKQIKENYVDLFNQPNITDIKSVEKKVKSLEEWITKISLLGPGSGEVNFKWLDDVDRSTISDVEQFIKYDPIKQKVIFENSGNLNNIDYITFNINYSNNLPPGTIDWNFQKDCLNIYQSDGTILQAGLENYIRVHNSTANTLENGTFVQFSGVYANSIPTCIPFLANSSSIPLYIIGVLTDDILPNSTGRATTLGEVNNINTTGSNVSENWKVGDLLWASPISPGKLTNIQPTAPNPVISVAAVINVDSNNGTLLVRPTIFPRLYFGSFFDTTNQIAANSNTAYAISFSNTSIASGFHIVNNSKIVAENPGLYDYKFSLQIKSNISSNRNLWIWYRKNGIDVPSSATQISVSSNKAFDIAAWNFMETMEKNDYFQLMWAVDDINVFLASPTATSFCPDIPCAILTVSQVNL